MVTESSRNKCTSFFLTRYSTCQGVPSTDTLFFFFCCCMWYIRKILFIRFDLSGISHGFIFNSLMPLKRLASLQSEISTNFCRFFKHLDFFPKLTYFVIIEWIIKEMKEQNSFKYFFFFYHYKRLLFKFSLMSNDGKFG